jgi:3-hydroxy-3-methylglutaryl CoA synthase
MGAVTVGIERIGAYPGSLALSMAALCKARDHDPADISDVMMIDERSLIPEWEDPVTMAVNAAKPMLTEEDRAKIGLLIVASESGVDQEKPMSTWVQRYLDLKPAVRNIEVKHACYGATASLHLAASWIASGAARGQKALVINSDLSRTHFGQPWEFVLGAGSAAVLLSDKPDVLEIELGANGVFTNEVSDLTRPTSRIETGNSETSLLSYLDALDGAFDDYIAQRPEAEDIENFFQRNIYHLPFGGMGFRAHKAVLRRIGITGKQAPWDHFVKRTLPSLAYVRRMGGTYGSSTFLGLMAMIETDDGLKSGDRIGMFSYGSGSCAELWSGILGANARASIARARLPALLNARKNLTVAEYEAVERARDEQIDCGDFTTKLDSLGDWYERYYAGKGLLVFSGMKEFYREYAWS